MEKIDWKRKLTSRKFWMALAGLIIGVLTLFNFDDSTVTQVGGLVITFGSVVAFIIGEGLVDAAAVSTNTDGNFVSKMSQAARGVISTVDSAAAEGSPTGAVQAASIKQDSALSE